MLVNAKSKKKTSLRRCVFLAKKCWCTQEVVFPNAVIGPELEVKLWGRTRDTTKAKEAGQKGCSLCFCPEKWVKMTIRAGNWAICAAPCEATLLFGSLAGFKPGNLWNTIAGCPVNPKTLWFISQHSCHLIWKNVCTRTDLEGGIYGLVGANRRHSDLPVARRQRSWMFLKYHYAGGRAAWTIAEQSGHIWQCLLVEGMHRSMACLVRSAAALHFDPSSSCWARCWRNPSQEHSFLWPWRLPTGLEAGRCGGMQLVNRGKLLIWWWNWSSCLLLFLLIASSKFNFEVVLRTNFIIK